VAGTDLPRISLHGLRHSSASGLYEAGVPEKVIQERLGHSSSRVTSDISLHLADRMDQEAVEKLGRVFAANGQ
jgi:integrase